MPFVLGLKTMCLTFLMVGSCLETAALWCERQHLMDPTLLNVKYNDLRSIRYNCSLLDFQFIRVILKYSIPFAIIFLFKPIVKVFNTSLKFFVFIFISIRIVPFFIPEYYRIFVTESYYKFNVLPKKDFINDFTYLAFVDMIIAIVLIFIASIFIDIQNSKKRGNKFVAESNDVEDEIDLNISSSGELYDVNLASESAVMPYNECLSEKLILPIALFFSIIILCIMRQSFLNEMNFDYVKLLKSNETIFNKSVEFLSENNVDLFSKRVRYGISKSTLHTDIRLIGLIHPHMIFSVNNFYYTRPDEALELGPLVHSMLQSKDNLVIFVLNCFRVLLFCVLVFSVLNSGFDEFIYKTTSIPVSILFVSYAMYVPVDTLVKVFINAIMRDVNVAHDCYPLTMGFNIGKIIENLYKADANYYTPTSFYKVLYLSKPTYFDHWKKIQRCIKTKV